MNNNHYRSKFGRIGSAGDAKQLERRVDSELGILNITNIFFIQGLQIMWHKPAMLNIESFDIDTSFVYSC